MDEQTNPCAFVPLSKYSWEIIPLLSGRRGACNGITLAWNPTVICLFVALHAVAVWTALSVCIQAVATFKRYWTLYFWYARCCGLVQSNADEHCAGPSF
jgi:hypothetical protein